MKTKNKHVNKMLEENQIQFSEVEQNFQKGKKRILSEKSDQEWKKVENYISTKINKILKDEQKNNFDLRKFANIKHIKENFPINIFVSKRGIGKSVSSKKLCEEYAEKRKGQFIWLRGTFAEADKFMNQESTQWFKDNGWYNMKSTGIIFRSVDHYNNFRKKNKISEVNERNLFKMSNNEKGKYLESLKFEQIDEEVVGYVEGLYSAAKTNRSMEKRGVRLIIYDEFQIWRKGEDQLGMLNDYVETVVRRKKDFYIVLHANYQNASNALIATLKKTHNRIDFNRFAGSIIINIPKECFNVEKPYITVAERLSYSSRATYMAREGDSYNKIDNKQVMLIPKDIDKEINPFAYIIYENTSFNVFEYGEDSLLICDDLWIPLDKDPNVERFVFTSLDWLKHQQFVLLKNSYIQHLIRLQRVNKIFYSSDMIHDNFVTILNRFKGLKENEDNFDIETI